MYGLMLLTILCGARCTTPPADSAIVWHYDLRAGDHLIYRERFRQEIDGREVFGLATGRDKPFGAPFVSASSYEWTSHVLVASVIGERVLVGVQRNRTRDDSIVTSLDTSTALSAYERERLRTRLLGRARFAQANILSPNGDAHEPWAARREMRSKILWDAFELPSLPTKPVQLGDHWQSTDPFAFVMHIAAVDTLGTERCYRAEGAASAAALIPRQTVDSNAVHVRIWYCPATQIVRRVELEGTYPNVNYYKIHETLSLELQQHTRGEPISGWLQSAELRQGALAALAIGDSSAISTALATPGLDSIYTGADSASVRMLLGIAFRAGARRHPSPCWRRCSAARTRVCARWPRGCSPASATR